MSVWSVLKPPDHGSKTRAPIGIRKGPLVRFCLSSDDSLESRSTVSTVLAQPLWSLAAVSGVAGGRFPGLGGQEFAA